MIEIFLLIILLGFVFMMIMKNSNLMSAKEVVGEIVIRKEAITEEEKNRNEIQETPDEVVEENVTTEDESKYGQVLADATYMEENRIYTIEANDEDEIVLLFGGDILFDESYAVMNSVVNGTGNIEDAFGDSILEEMVNADIFMVNNEFTYTDRGTPTEDKSFTFRANPSTANYLDDLGIDLVSLANNHAYDYGEVSLLDTIDTLNEVNMPYVGAGINIDEAKKPVYFIVNDTKIAFVAATQIERYENPDTKEATATSAGVFRCLYIDPMLEVIKEAKENSDFVIVFPHWGTENEEYPDWAQLEQAPQMVEAGADLIVGAHPHVLQGMEYIDGVPVAYSLGNFWFNSMTLDNGLLKVIIKENEIDTVQFLPGLQSGCKTILLEGTEKSRVLTYMEEISTDVEIDEDGFVTKIS